MCIRDSDSIGLTLSGICLVHCIVLPVVAFVLPVSAGLYADADSAWHWVLLGLALPISGYAFIAAWMRHRAASSLILGGAGLFVMGVGVSHVFGHDYEVVFTVVGVCAVAAAHIANFLHAHARTQSRTDSM